MKRLKKILKWTGVVLGAFVAVGLIVNAWFIWSTDSHLAEQLEEIRAAGEPLTLAELAREPIPPEQNAATYLRQAKTDIVAIDNTLFDYTPNVWFTRWNRNQSPPADGLVLIKNSFSAHPNVIPLLERAAGCPHYDAQLDYRFPLNVFDNLGPEVQYFREISRILQPYAYLLVSEGKRDEAVRTGILIFSLVRFSNDHPTLVSYMVAITNQRIAVETINFALQAGPVSDEVRNELIAELEHQKQLSGYLSAVISERAFQIDAFRSIPGRNLWLYKRGYWNEQESGCLEMLKTMAALAESSMPYSESKKILLDTPTNIQESITPPLDGKFYPIGPTCGVILNSAARAKAMIRSLRVLNALQDITAAESNDMPDLIKLGLPIETTIDPFTGKPLHVKKTPRGWLVYSDGPNLQDDGGRFLGDAGIVGDAYDIGVGPPPAATAEK